MYLDAQGDTNAEFTFQIGSSLTVADYASVTLTAGALPCNIYWQVGSSASLGVGSSFAGNIVAHATVALNTGASLNGRVISLTAAVTLLNNAITTQTCGGPHCAGPYFLVPESDAGEANCTACDSACSECTAVTADKTDGCDRCAYGYYSNAGETNSVCVLCNDEAAAADARAAGTVTCHDNGAQFYFEACMDDATEDAACMAVSSQSALASAITGSATTCASAGAYYFTFSTWTSDASCTPCESGCAACTSTECTTCDAGLTMNAGGMCAPPVSASPTTDDGLDDAADHVSRSALTIVGVIIACAALFGIDA